MVPSNLVYYEDEERLLLGCLAFWRRNSLDGYLENYQLKGKELATLWNERYFIIRADIKQK